ncbi:MAG: flavodoxin family protein [Chloroflexota bacterium]
MQALGIAGSPRKGGNTEQYVQQALKAINDEGIETEMVSLADKDIRPCNACMACRRTEKCPIDDDLMPIYQKMKDADAIIIGSPVYFQGSTALTRAFLERSGYISTQNGRVFAGKVGGPLVVTRRSAASLTYAQMLLWFSGQRFFIPGVMSTAFGREKGDVLKDEEGMNSARDFGKGVAFLLKKLKA